LQSFSGLFLTSGFISSLMLLIRIMRLAHARWTELRHGDADRMDNTPGDEECRKLQDGASNIPMLDHPHGLTLILKPVTGITNKLVAEVVMTKSRAFWDPS
jgi:hypothetical protein